MTQTAYNGHMALPAGEWTLISEIDCTFQVVSGAIEVLGMDGAAPTFATDGGIVYEAGEGEEAATGTLVRFTGGGTIDRLYAKPHGSLGATIFLSRAAVA